jgi:excisionase family DNA binding protein
VQVSAGFRRSSLDTAQVACETGRQPQEAAGFQPPQSVTKRDADALRRQLRDQIAAVIDTVIDLAIVELRIETHATLPPPESPPAVNLAPYLTIAQTAEYLQMSRRTIERLAHSGEIDATGKGRLRRVSRASINAYIERGRTGIARTSSTPQPVIVQLAGKRPKKRK